MDALELGRQMLEYCRKYKIPQDYVMDILNDQKVMPMIRGKATEYAVELLLRDILPARVGGGKAQPQRPKRDS